ncbi:benzoylformate decarboxylase [Williamsia soli]|uniref:benzoylformate decarboxylase n=1 Tax=Williamsia soli TaxID=364929 RepID=UPI001AA003E2|nr:benzoylformate decarboxylase [Williamsia soli]
MATTSEATYALLRAHGLTTIFGNPGSNELPFLSGMPADFRYILGLHEGGVVSMADGYSLVRGEGAFINLHAASGSGNAMGALTNSVYSHSPLIVTAGQQVRSTIGQEVMLANVDAPSLMRPLVKYSAEPTCAEDVPRTMSQAINLATSAPRGPVYVSVPYDDWAKDAAEDSAEELSKRVVHSGTGLSETQLDRLTSLLAEAENPVLILGPAVDAQAGNDDAVTLAEKLQAPVWIAPSPSRCPFPTRHPAFRGVLPAGIADLAAALDGHDLAVVIGAPVFRYHQYVPGRYLPSGTSLVHLTDDPSEASRAPVGEAFVVPVGAALAALAESVPPTQREPLRPLPDFAEPEVHAGGLDPAHLFARIRTQAPDDAIYVNESTSTSDAFWSQMDLSQQGSYFFPASGGLGFGLPAAVGAQLGSADRQVIGLIGDGSANYGITALWTAAQYEIPVVVIILKNGTYGALRGFGRLLKTGETPGLDVPDIDFVHLAEGYGVSAVSVDNADDFDSAFKEALSVRKPRLIEVTTTYTA